MKKLSLKLKITLWYSTAMIVVSTIVLVAMNSITADIIDRDVSERIISTAEETTRMSIDFKRNKLRPIPDFGFFVRGVHMVIYNSDNKIIAGQSPFGISDDMPVKNELLRNETYNGNNYKVYDKKITTPNGTIFSIKGMVSLEDETAFGKSTFKTNILITLIMILVAAAGGYLIISKALRPAEQLNTMAEMIIDSGDLSQRINIKKNCDEISNLASTFDRMLDKIQNSFENEKQFTSDASHELRTPVAVIMSECEFMEECAETIEDFKESSASVKRQAEKMSKLVSELLMISRMDNNTVNLNFEKIDIAELLNFVCEEQQEIQPKNISLTLNTDTDIYAIADKGLIARAFINLISNAYKYSKDNGHIHVSLTKNNGNVTFSVKDDGIGIYPENIDKIWERFYQEDSSRTSNDNDSLGLGLSMVKWISKCHGGKVCVNSKPGIGSEFIFSFPDNFDINNKSNL